jgi:hypothetical protein
MYILSHSSNSKSIYLTLWIEKGCLKGRGLCLVSRIGPLRLWTISSIERIDVMPKWKKLGRVYCPSGEESWMKSHASNTVPMLVGEKIVRVYFNSRDEDSRSHISWVEIELDGEEFEVIRHCDKPVLSPGESGYFDESGVSLGCIVNVGGSDRIYYIGWTLGRTVPWYNYIGAATLSESGEEATRISKAPIYSRTDEDPISHSYPYLVEFGGAYFVYYGSNRSWGEDKFSMDHVIKLAESGDGLSFEPTGTEVIYPKNEGEYAFSRPYVFIDDEGVWKMYYSFRGESYRIGYAESLDGKSWKRMDGDAGIGVSKNEEDWDAEMICYAYLFSKGGRTYMTYNGNGYGRTGFGLAILEDC